MLDTSLLPKRDATLASADDDSLFVSQDSDDIQPITNGNLPDTISSSGAQDSASGLRQAVEQSAQLPSNGQSAFQGDGSMPPSWGLNSQRPSEPPRNFSSVFSAGTANTASPFAVSTTTPSTAPSNPFGALPSPFTSNKAAEDEKGPSMFSTSPAPQPAPSATPPNPFATSPAPFTSNKAQEGPKENALFPISSAQNPAHTFPTSPGQSQFTGRQDNTATNTTAPASITPQFKLPSFTQPISSPVSTTPQSTLPAFSQPTFNPPTTTDSNKNANLTPGQTSASIFDSAKPSPICISSSSPFSVPSQDTEPKETTLKERPAEPASPVFSFPGQSAAPNEMYASEHAAEPAPAFNFPTQSATQPARFAQETPFPRFSSSAPSALFPPRQAGKAIIIQLSIAATDNITETEPAFPSTAPETTPSSSIFSNATPPQVSTPEKADFGNLGVFGSTITPEKQEKDMPASQEQISSHPGHRYVQHGPLDSTGASGDLTLPSDPKESEAAEPPNGKFIPILSHARNILLIMFTWR